MICCRHWRMLQMLTQYQKKCSQKERRFLQKNIREEITSAADRGYATGELASSVIPDTPEKNAFGHYVSVRPVGIDSKGVRNGEKWGYLENGNGGNQKPHPFEDKATKRSETECTEKMQEVFNRHINI